MAYQSRKKQRKPEDPYKYVSRLLRYRLRSEKELRQRLLERYSEDVVEEVMKKLKEKGIVDDARFALMFAKDELSVYKHGPWIIKAKLKSLGVDEELIDEAIEKAMEEFDLEAFLREVLKKKEDRRKARDYLFKRGFDPSLLDNVDIEIDRG